jgi:hypothetical protein
MSHFPYNEASVKSRLFSIKYNRNGPVTTITPKIVTGIVENRGMIIDNVDALTLSSSVSADFIFGATMSAR